MKKNEKLIGECISYTYEGMGVVKKDGFPIFVKNMLEGETGEIVITKVLKNFAYGRCLTLIKESSERVKPVCPIDKQCGGCQISHMSVKEQKRFKTQRVQDCITRIAKMDFQVKDVLTMENPYHYRNKAQIPVGVKDDRVICGFYRIHSNDIIDMDECLIQHPATNKMALLIKDLIQEYGNGEYFRHLLLKVGFISGEMMVVLIVKNREVPHLKEMVERISRFDEVKSIILNINTTQGNVILGDEEEVLYGKDSIEDTLQDLKFHISSKSFYQVNPIQTVNLYNIALKYANLSGNESVLDLYCGIGTITLFMAKKAKHVIGIEIVPEAIVNAKENASLNHIENVDFICSDAASYASKVAEENQKIDVICVDPPRKGCDEITLQSIIKMDPTRIVYVSCDPSTLARDLKYLSEHDYEVKEIQPVDMFPNSYHVETVVLMSRVHTPANDRGAI